MEDNVGKGHDCQGYLIFDFEEVLTSFKFAHFY